MWFDGSVSENLWGDFFPENGRLHRHFSKHFLNNDATSILWFIFCRCAYVVRIFLRWENWSSIIIEKMFAKMAVESTIFREKSAHKFHISPYFVWTTLRKCLSVTFLVRILIWSLIIRIEPAKLLSQDPCCPSLTQIRIRRFLSDNINCCVIAPSDGSRYLCTPSLIDLTNPLRYSEVLMKRFHNIFRIYLSFPDINFSSHSSSTK